MLNDAFDLKNNWKAAHISVNAMVDVNANKNHFNFQNLNRLRSQTGEWI